jgi:hypothetical protein
MEMLINTSETEVTVSITNEKRPSHSPHLNTMQAGGQTSINNIPNHVLPTSRRLQYDIRRILNYKLSENS